MKDDQKDQKSVNESQEHCDIPSFESQATSELDAAPSWTPGPWQIKNSSSPSPHERVRILGADGKSVASSAAYRSTLEAEANARLIAAAPALYAALRSCEQEMRTVRGACTDEYEDAVNNAVRALALASGQETNTLASSGKSSPSE